MDQGGRFQRLTHLLLGQSMGGQPAQLVVNQGQQLRGRVGIAGIETGQDARRVAHPIKDTSPSIDRPMISLGSQPQKTSNPVASRSCSSRRDLNVARSGRRRHGNPSGRVPCSRMAARTAHERLPGRRNVDHRFDGDDDSRTAPGLSTVVADAPWKWLHDLAICAKTTTHSSPLPGEDHACSEIVSRNQPSFGAGGSLRGLGTGRLGPVRGRHLRRRWRPALNRAGCDQDHQAGNVSRQAEVVVPRVRNAGIVGLGEPVVEGRAQTVATAVKEIEPYLVGKDPRRVVHHWQAIYRHAFYRGGPILTSALSGIDMALWDIKGKALGVPVYELLKHA